MPSRYSLVSHFGPFRLTWRCSCLNMVGRVKNGYDDYDGKYIDLQHQFLVLLLFSLRGVLGGTLAGISSQGSSRTPVVETLSCGRKGSLRKGGNLLRQARPPGLRAFPGLNGTLVPAPRESNFHNTSSGRGSSISELRPSTVRLLHRLPYRRAGPAWVYGCLAWVSGWDLGALLRGVVSFVPLLALNSPLFAGLK